MRQAQVQQQLIDNNPDFQVDDFVAKNIMQTKRASHVLFESKL